MMFGFDWPAVSEEKIFEIVDGRRTTDDGRTTDDDGRTPEHGHPISSPCEGSDELKSFSFYRIVRSIYVKLIICIL